MSMKNAEPLYYAIIRLFTDGREHSTEDVVAKLKPVHGTQKLFTTKDVDEALATAKENGLLEVTGYELNGDKSLSIRYRASDFGLSTARRYLS